VTADRDQALGFNFCAQIAAWMRSGGALLGFSSAGVYLVEAIA
jgi:hypothetical protein